MKEDVGNKPLPYNLAKQSCTTLPNWRFQLTLGDCSDSSATEHNHLLTLSFPPNGFTVYWTLSSKCFSPFLHGTCPLSVSHLYSALGGVYHPLGTPIPNNPTQRLSTLSGTSFKVDFRPEQWSSGPGQFDSPDLTRDFRPGHFVRHYWGNFCWFLFLRLLISLNSAGEPCSIWAKYKDKSCTYVGLYGSGLFNFRSYVNLSTSFACFLGFDVPTSSFIFIENVFIYRWCT